jgi:hypothetical protein
MILAIGASLRISSISRKPSLAPPASGGEAQIHGDHLRLQTAQGGQRGFPIRGQGYFQIITETPAHLALEARIIFNNQESFSHKE